MSQQSTIIEPITSQHRIPPGRLVAMVGLWALAVAAGFAILTKHDLSAGQANAMPQHWPSGSSLTPSQSGPTLVMFIHPHCPCTTASLEQLASLARDEAFRSATAYLLVVDVADSESGENVAQARRIPGAVVQFDARNAESLRFGSRTSGTTLIFDATGRLTFEGGITAARGHHGENSAATAALSALQGASRDCVRMPVFGCPLRNEGLASTD